MNEINRELVPKKMNEIKKRKIYFFALYSSNSHSNDTPTSLTGTTNLVNYMHIKGLT